MTAKEQIIDAVQTFAHDLIDDIIVDRSNVAVAFLSDKIKISADNVISKYEDELDDVLLYITDKEGNINVLDFDEESMKSAFNEMPVMDYQIKKVKCSIGKGCIDIFLPENFITKMLLGDERVISLNYNDVTKLIELIKS